MSTETVAMPSLDRQIAQGGAWMVAARLTVWSIALVGIILARFLKPSDFGAVSLGMAAFLIAVCLLATSGRQQRLSGAQTDLKGRHPAITTIALARIFAAFGGLGGNRCHFK